MEENSRPSASSKPSSSDPKPTRPLYSSKLGDGGKARTSENVNSSSPTASRQPPVAQKAWASAKNPITGRSSQTPQQNTFNPANSKQSTTNSLREGQRVRVSLNTGAEFEGIYANNQADPTSFYLRMVQQRRVPGDMANGTSRKEQSSMSFLRKDVVDARPIGGNANKSDGKMQNGNRSNFRTDSTISGGRPGGERALQPWVPDTVPDSDGSLEKSASGGGKWDQFAENERLFGLKTDYDENIYTTAIDKSHPQYKERMVAAEKKAREIERSVPTTAHVAEERVMDFVSGEGKGGDEEDKYSGVHRQDFPPLQNRENKYTPPARRAPTGQATAYGAPVDPAIIASQLKGGQAKRQMSQKTDEAKSPLPTPNKPATPQVAEAKTTDSKPEPKPEPKTETKPEPKPEPKPAEVKPTEKPNDSKPAASLRPSAATAVRNVSPPDRPSATSTVEHDVLKEFRTFAIQQRVQAEKVRSNKAKADAHVKLQELKRFADNFKLSTPVPSDLISIIAKDPAKQKQIQEKAMQNAEDIAKAKAAAAKEKEATPAKDATVKPTAKDPQPATNSTPTTHATPENRNTSRPSGPQHTPSANQGQRHQGGGRQSYGPGYNNSQYRNDRSSGPYGGPQNRQAGGTLAERLRRVEQDRHSRPVPMQHGPDQRQPPTGPANNMDMYNRRMGPGPMPMPMPMPMPIPAAHMAKLNPHSNEFRPSPFATSFNPNISGPSTGSSPRSVMNNVVPDPQAVTTPVAGQLIRRKTKAVDVQKCFILSHIKTFVPPPMGRNWDENDGLRPSYDTLPTWRQLKDDEKSDSTMHMTYTEYLEKMPYASTAMATPNPPHVMPQLAHQHQLPFHLQHGAHMPPRQSPHMPPMPMHAGQPNHMPHMSFGGGTTDDHRMMHSNSAQSYASPRMTQVPIGYPPPAMNSPAQIPYNQGVMPPFMPATPQMNNFRSFSNNPQYMPQQNSPMTMPVMPSQFLPAPNGLIAGGPQMPIYAGGHQQFVAPGGGAAPPQPIPGSNGYPSPGRPAAPMMAQQGSQQGQPMYGASPSMQFQQPVFPSQQHPSHMNMRGYNGAGPQQFGTSPSQMHQYGGQHRNSSNNYSGNNKNYQGHAHHQGGQQTHQVTPGQQGRSSDGPEEGK